MVVLLSTVLHSKLEVKNENQKITMGHYIFQVLCLLTLVAVPVSLSKKRFGRKVRMIVAFVPIVTGLASYLITHETNGIFVALIGLWALFFVTIHPHKDDENDKGSKD